MDACAVTRRRPWHHAKPRRGLVDTAASAQTACSCPAPRAPPTPGPSSPRRERDEDCDDPPQRGGLRLGRLAISLSSGAWN